MALLLHPGSGSPTSRTGFWTHHGLPSQRKSPQTVKFEPVWRWHRFSAIQWKLSCNSWGLPGRTGSLYRSCPISVFTRVVSDS